MNQPTKIFDSETVLPDDRLSEKQTTLLGFDARYSRVRDQLRLLLNIGELGAWSRKFHGGKLAICDLVAEQYPLVIFHGDVGTGTVRPGVAEIGYSGSRPAIGWWCRSQRNR